MRLHKQRPRRRALSMIWALTVLSVVTLLTATLARQMLLDRRAIKLNSDQAQRVWLARAGIEIAAERLLHEPASYTGETVELVPRSQVRIEIKSEKENMVLVISAAHYPTDDRDAVKTMTQRFRRIVEKERVRLVPIVMEKKE